MAENFNLHAEIGATISGVEDLGKLVSELGHLEEQLGGTLPPGLDKLNRDFVRIEGAGRAAAAGVGAAARAAQEASGFAAMEKDVEALTESLRRLAQESVVAGERSPISTLASSMSVEEMERILAVQEAAGASAAQIAREKQRQLAAEAREQERLAELEERQQRELAQGEARLRQQQQRGAAAAAAEENRQHEIRMRHAQERIEAEKRISLAAQGQNASSARGYREGQQDPASFLGQANSRDASAGLRASDTTWAQETQAVEDLNLTYDAHVQSYDRVMAQKSTASQQNALYNQYLYDEAKASEAAADAVDEHTAALPRLRYALYDVAQTAGVVQAAIGASGAAVLTASASYESSFTNVERTTLATAEATSVLREDLMQLTRDIPEAWGSITEIASVGAQLNIAEEDLASFTETTTKFSTVTGVAAETSAMAFGSIGQLLGVTAAEYEQMGSAIAYVGVTSVATDAEIISMSQRLAASAANAGMTAQEVIGLSGALASLRVAPERAQGVMEKYFSVLNTSIAEGGERLDAFARIAGTTSDQVAGMVASDPAHFFRELAVGLGELDPVSTTLALDELGLSGLRAGEVFTRVSNNVEVFDQALANSNQAWADGSHLADAYGLVVDDLASKWQIFLNGVMEFGAAVGDVLAPAAKLALDIITPMVQQLAAFVNTPFGKWATIAVAALGGVVFALAGIIGTTSLAIATLAALGTAMQELGVKSVVGVSGLRAMSGALTEVAASAGLGARSIGFFKGALISSGIGLAVLMLGSLASAFLNAASSAEGTLERFVGSTSGLSAAIQADYAAYDEALASGNQEAVDSFTVLADAQGQSTEKSSEHSEAMLAAADMLGVTVQKNDEATSSIENQTVVLGENAYAWLENALVRSEEFQKIASNAEFAAAWGEAGLSMRDVLDAAAANGEAGVYDLFARMSESTGNAASVYLSGIEEIIVRIADSFVRLGDMIRRGTDLMMSNPLDGVGYGLNFAQLGAELNEIWTQPTFNHQARELARFASDATNQARTFGSAARQAGIDASAGAEGVRDLNNGLGNTGGAADSAAAAVRTVKDYANDLSKVWDRAFDIRWSGEQTLDSVRASWNAIGKAIEDARDKMAKYQADLGLLAADRYTMTGWLAVAEDYGDLDRAQELRAKLAELDVKEADTKKKLQVEQDKTNKSLNGNSDAAIANRKEILGLVSGYQDHIEALAASGMSSEDLGRQTAILKQQFIDQATQLGYSRTEVMKYAEGFDHVAEAIRNVPRNVTVEISGLSAAQAALREFEASIKRATNNGKGYTVPVRTVGDNSGLASSIIAQRNALQAKINTFPQGMSKTQAHSDALRELMGLNAQIRGLGYRKGGYTGDGGVNDIAGVVHGKEFVFSAPAVRSIGRSNLAYMHDSAKRGRSVSAGSGMPSSMMVELSPFDRQLLVDVRNAAGVNISGDAIARASLAGAVNAGRTGRG